MSQMKNKINKVYKIFQDPKNERKRTYDSLLFRFPNSNQLLIRDTARCSLFIRSSSRNAACSLWLLSGSTKNKIPRKLVNVTAVKK